MPISIKPYEDNYFKAWDKFVWESVNGTIFHTRLFLSYHPKDRFRDGSLVFRKNDEIFALFTAARGIWDG
ncbi:MAG: GNAT family N-acetyltransferase, partial [Candidatus Marinimicrobia bacterium]|nr:GNAT family N-acetyltransferase [Candidatus Neomarinimicrobiota bacterium]